MPIWLRRFYIRKINETLENERKATKSVTKPDVPKVSRPGLVKR